MRAPGGKMYCTYCGKLFSRKEHLERHIARHTGVKPYRCPECSISYARRDLLQRHINQYHQAKDPMERTQTDAETLAGHPKIACLPCSQAKTACDKGAPCARCREKNFECKTRYAKRPQKGARNAAAMKDRGPVPIPTTAPAPRTGAPSFRNIGGGAGHRDLQARFSATMDNTPMTIDPRIPLQMGSPKRAELVNTNLGLDGRPTPPLPIDGYDFSGISNDIVSQEPGVFDSHYLWPSSTSGLEMYHNLSQPSLFSPFNSLTSPMSEITPLSTEPIHTRSNSMMSTGDFESSMRAIAANTPQNGQGSDFDAMSIGNQAWPLAQCNPVVYPDDCPDDPIVHLKNLEQSSKYTHVWNILAARPRIAPADITDSTSGEPMSSHTHDALSHVAQRFLMKALLFYRDFSQTQHYTFSAPTTSFFALPPAAIMDSCLRCCVRSLSFYYSLVSTGQVNSNMMMGQDDNTSLFILLMVAQGASVVPHGDIQELSVSLAETCKMQLFDIIEKTVTRYADLTVHRCALLFTVLGAWSGHKNLMDVAVRQRGVYLDTLKRVGMFFAPQNRDQANAVVSWSSWLDRETKCRLISNWIMVDQEISLFYDIPPFLSVRDLNSPLPGPAELWAADSPEQWEDKIRSRSGNYTDPVSEELLNSLFSTPSLNHLYQKFKADDSNLDAITPHQLRLLLHPLQAFQWHIREITLHTHGAPGHNDRNEIQKLLQRWEKLSNTYFKYHPTCMMSRANLVLYHLIALNLVTSFPDIESFAREGRWCEPENQQSERSRCFMVVKEAIYRCGQVIRLVRTMPKDQRPIWWSAAIYRVMLILWAHSALPWDLGHKSEPPVVIDKVALEDHVLYEYLWRSKGIPVLSGPDGSSINIDASSDIIGYGINLLESINTRLDSVIRQKLIDLQQRWHGAAHSSPKNRLSTTALPAIISTGAPNPSQPFSI
ncbi:hypothetical protein F4777DRAFT_498652 [Nemania sp. FL0916]|nr:hypothetical protein F4777DRAFT_498652 [Nemania sp. FL0916]